MEKHVILMGGGLDSYLVLLYMLHDAKISPRAITALYVNYENVAADLEEEAAEKQCRKYGIRLKIDWDSIISRLNPQPSIMFGTSKDSPMLYGRNLVLFLYALQYGDNIWMGLDKPFVDRDFPDLELNYYYTLIGLIGKPDVTINAPFIDVDKEEAIRRFLTIDPNIFDNTMSCYNPGIVDGKVQECGKCSHCTTKTELKKRILGV